jgi:hypothetical protein
MTDRRGPLGRRRAVHHRARPFAGRKVGLRPAEWLTVRGCGAKLARVTVRDDRQPRKVYELTAAGRAGVVEPLEPRHRPTPPLPSRQLRSLRRGAGLSGNRAVCPVGEPGRRGEGGVCPVGEPGRRGEGGVCPVREPGRRGERDNNAGLSAGVGVHDTRCRAHGG